MKVSIIVPVYKGEQTLEPLFNFIRTALDGIIDYEVIFICDNAIDGSWSIIKNLRNKHPRRVKGYRLKHNYGQHKAILFGFTVASGEYVVTMDEDMQHDPANIPAMLDLLMKNDLDVVYGNFTDIKKGKLRKAGSNLGRWLAVNVIPGLHKGYSPFRLIKAEVARRLKCEKSIVFIDGLLAAIDAKAGNFTIEHLENQRPSSYSFYKLAIIAFSVILSYSRKARITFIIFSAILISPALWNIVTWQGSVVFIRMLLTMALLVSLAFLVLVRSTIRKVVKVSETTGGFDSAQPPESNPTKSKPPESNPPKSNPPKSNPPKSKPPKSKPPKSNPA